MRQRLAVIGLVTVAVAAWIAGPVGPAVAGPTGTARAPWPVRAKLWRDTGPGGVTASAVTLPPALTGYLRADRTDLQWSLAATHLPQAWTRSTGAGVVVATLDTGADAASPDLTGRLLAGAHLDPVTARVVAGSRPDILGHGTHVAGIIAGKDDGHGITGVAPDAKILPVNLNTGDGVLTGVVVASGMDWAVAHGAQVINLSLGFADIAAGAADVRTICRAVAAAVAAKVVVVASAGNDGQGSDNPEAPARCPGAISVAALDSSLRSPAWSSYDSTVTLAAPGDMIYSTVIGDTTPLRYALESGTSMSSPFVAGVAALLLAQHPDWTPAEVRDRLVRTAADLPPAGDDPRTGAGAVDPAAAVGASAPAPEPVASLSAQAEPYASRVDPSGRPVFDRVAVHWLPDPTAEVTGYRVTRWTSAATTSTDLPASAVRAVFPAGAAGYGVTALTADGEVPAAPVWFPLAGQDMTPVAPVTGLHVAWGRSGSISVVWSNPVANRGLADEWAVSVDGEIVVQGEKVAVPNRAVIPATKVPGGDLVIDVLIGSSISYDSEDTRAALAARLPYTGVAVSAGRGRYRVDLLLAPSRRPGCGRGRCIGTPVLVGAGGYTTRTRIDSRGHLVALVSSAARHGRVVVAVSVRGRPALSDRAVSLPVA